MGLELGDLIKEIRETSARVSERDTAAMQRIAAVEKSVNEIFLKTNRPGFGGARDDDIERKDAVEFCRIKRELTVPKNDGLAPIYTPSPADIDEAFTARKALHSLFRHGNFDRLDVTERKSLTSFSFGSNQFVLPPQMSDRVLTCLVDPTDIAGLMGQATTSGGSLKFLIDNVRMQDAAWACEASCFANNPQADLQDGLGELEIKVETIRYVVCAGSDLLQDAAFNIEAWILRKVTDGFRVAISNSIVMGDGLGKPMGFLNPNAGTPILVAEHTGGPDHLARFSDAQIRRSRSMARRRGVFHESKDVGALGHNVRCHRPPGGALTCPNAGRLLRVH